MIGERRSVLHERHQLHVAHHEARVAREAILALATDLVQLLARLRDVLLALLPGLLVDHVMRVLFHGRGRGPLGRGPVGRVVPGEPWRAIVGRGSRRCHTVFIIGHAGSGKDSDGEKRSHFAFLFGLNKCAFVAVFLLRRIKSIIELNFEVATKVLDLKS